MCLRSRKRNPYRGPPENSTIDEREVQKYLGKLETNKSTRPYALSPKLTSELKQQILKPSPPSKIRHYNKAKYPKTGTKRRLHRSSEVLIRYLFFYNAVPSPSTMPLHRESPDPFFYTTSPRHPLSIFYFPSLPPSTNSISR